VIAQLVPVALPLLFFGRAVVGRIVLLQGDAWKQNFPLRVLAGRLIAEGQLPLWNPYIFGGTPLMASVYPGVFYPPNWLFALLPGLAAMHIVVITTYHIALIGTYLYARRIGLDRLSSLVAGMIFTFGAFMVAHLEQTSRIAAAAWLPWILLAIEHLYHRTSWKWISLGALVVALQLFAGEPQMTCYSAMTAGAYAIFCAFFRGVPLKPRFAVSLIALAAIGVLLSSIQLLPQWELLRQSDRSNIDYEYFSAFSFPPRQILTFMMPFFYGGAAAAPYYKSYTGEWNIMTTSGYAGLLTLMLGLVAIIMCRHLDNRNRRQLYFWLVVALAALILSFGVYLPFGLHRALHHVPLYNLFRGSYRNFFELTFALAVVAGIGTNYLKRTERGSRVWIAAAGVALLTIGAEILYIRRGGRMSDGEAVVPLFVVCLSTAALMLFAAFGGSRPSLFAPSRLRVKTILRWGSGAFLLLALMIDLGSFGSHFYWTIVPSAFAQRASDPPALKYIKDRETDFHSFRIISHAVLPYDYEYIGERDINFELTDRPDASVMRGIESVNGNDLLRPSRFAGLTGINGFGIAADTGAFSAAHRGLDLLNVKYLLLERRGAYANDTAPDVPPHQIDYYGLLEGRAPLLLEQDGVRFSKSPLNLSSARVTASLRASGAYATSIVVRSNLANAAGVAGGSPVAHIRLKTVEGAVIERDMLAGRDTSEWAYDRPDVLRVVKHARAKVAESTDAGGFQSHIYEARFDFDRSHIEQVEFSFPQSPATLQIIRVSLFDTTTKLSEMLSDLELPSQRWRLLTRIGDVEVYENVSCLPRAWFVSEVRQSPDEDTLNALRRGNLDPSRTALIPESIPAGTFAASDEGTTKLPAILEYKPQRIVLESDRSTDGFLVLSENYYAGWKAEIDGQSTKIYQTDFSLRGIVVPKGKHRIEFSYMPASFVRGALLSALGVGLLIAGSIWGRWPVRSGR